MIARGDVCWVDLGPIVDRGPAKHRPVVIVQSDDYTRSRLGRVVVAAISSSATTVGTDCAWNICAISGTASASTEASRSRPAQLSGRTSRQGTEAFPRGQMVTGGGDNTESLIFICAGGIPLSSPPKGSWDFYRILE